MTKIAADAQREGAARGLNITCKMIPLGGDLLNNNQQVYGTDCTVNGNPGQDAALLLTGSGFEIAAVEASRVAGKPMMSAPQFAASAGYQFLAPTSQQSPAALPTAPVGTVKTTPPPSAIPPVSPTPTVPTSTASKILSDVSTIAEQAQAAVADFGIPTWVWYAGAAGAAAFFLMKGKR
jgi:hypothetical protein